MFINYALNSTFKAYKAAVPNEYRYHIIALKSGAAIHCDKFVCMMRDEVRLPKKRPSSSRRRLQLPLFFCFFADGISSENILVPYVMYVYVYFKEALLLCTPSYTSSSSSRSGICTKAFKRGWEGGLRV